MFLMEDVDGEVTKVLVEVSAPLRKGMEYWVINEAEKDPADRQAGIYPINPVTTDEEGNPLFPDDKGYEDGTKHYGPGLLEVPIQSTLLVAPKGSPIIPSPEQTRFELDLMNDKFFNEEKVNKRELSIDEKIKLWINENIPNSPNKEDYKRAFKVTCKQPKPKECGNPVLLDKIHEEFEPTIGDQMLRKRLTVFKNTFPF